MLPKSVEKTNFLYLTIYYAIHNTSAQNLSKINAMINPLVVESLTVNNTTRRRNIYYLYNFVPNNFIECDLDLKIA